MRPAAMLPGDHGGDAAQVAAALGIDPRSLIDLSMSMNPFAPDVRSVLSRHLDAIDRYPDPTADEERLAEVVGVDRSLVVLTNGGSEAISLVGRHVGVGSLVAPEFSLYRRALAAVDDSAPRWRSNPSNPLGALTDPSTARPGEVWDEAFFPLATGRWTAHGLDGSGAWRLGSLTKLWACPGLRIGYVIAPDEHAADAIRRLRPQWSVNGPALAAIAPLLDATDLTAWSTRVVALRGRFADALRGHGWTVHDTSANWVVVDDAPGLRESLARGGGVLVRDCSNFGLPGTFRVALPRPAEFDRVVDAFAHVAADRPPAVPSAGGARQGDECR